MAAAADLALAQLAKRERRCDFIGMSDPAAASHTVLQPMVDKLNYHFQFSEADRAALSSLPVTIKRVNRQEFIVRDSDCATHSCALLEGTAVRSNM